MGDAESAPPASKKRVAGRQISKENPEVDDDGPEPEAGTFQRASDEVLATRRILKVRRPPATTAASSNPFASIRLVPSSNSSAEASKPSVHPDTVADKTVSEKKDDAGESKDKSGDDKVVEEAAQLVEPSKELENGGKEAREEIGKEDNESENKTVEETKKDAGEETEKNTGEGTEKNAGNKIEKDVGEETEKVVGEETEREKLENDKKDGETEKVVGEETEKVVGEETETEKLENDKKDASKQVASLSSFRQLSSSQNAFTGLAGTGFGTSSFSFGSIAKEGPTFGASSGSIFGFKSENPSYPSFGAGSSNNGTFSLQSSGTSVSDVTKNGVGGVTSMQEVSLETGEENEKAVFTADAILFEYLDGGWKERGKGELKVNTSISGAEKARLVMRARGNYRLILNASLYPDMKLTNMDKKGVTFACVNSAGEGKAGLATFALKFKDSSFAEEFREAVTTHKGKKATMLKTPENSPKASEE